jgi:hypothetical protein
MNSSVKAAFRWKPTLTFFLVATFLILFIGWLVLGGSLPLKTIADYSDLERNTIRVFLSIAVLLGIILPAIAFFVWFRKPQPRRILGFYLLVLVVQVITEMILSQALFPSIVVLIGTIYTAYRVWQLWQGQHWLTTSIVQFHPRHQKTLLVLLWLLLVFWSSNLIMLLIVGWPSLVG